VTFAFGRSLPVTLNTQIHRDHPANDALLLLGLVSFLAESQAGSE